jgi:hypothetical protein
VKRASVILTDRGLNLPDDQRRMLHGRILVDLNARWRDDNREVAAVNGQIDNVGNIAAQGYSLPPEQLGAVRARVEASKNPALISRLQQVEATLPIVQAWRQMNPDQLQQELENLDRGMRDKGATPAAMELRQTGDKLRKEMWTQIKTDPLGWAARTGVQDVPPIDWGKPEAVGQMQGRAARSEVIAQHYGQPVSYLRPAERTMLEAAASKGGEPMVTVANTLADGFGTKAPLAMREVAKDAPVLAHIGALTASGGSQQFVMDVAEGEKLRRDSDDKDNKLFCQNNLTRTTRSKRSAQLLYKDAFLLAPESGRAAIAAAERAFFARALRRGLDPTLGASSSTVGATDKAAFDRTIQEAAGATFASDGNSMAA